MAFQCLALSSESEMGSPKNFIGSLPTRGNIFPFNNRLVLSSTFPPLISKTRHLGTLACMLTHFSHASVALHIIWQFSILYDVRHLSLAY